MPPPSPTASATTSQAPADSRSPYVVVARRYRPQTFADLVGQEHIGEALAGAIRSNRIGHAYLFTGARGVGKTSAARIFAKALNCEFGPAPEPCNHCSICEDITAGSDLDVIEIDAASNRGIDEIRVLRENAGKGTARDRFKIYIVDEVHMLTREAFNALLKTLEEPPRHVKFIFCTTEPEKIPITILSRCQRFDFAGIQTGSIVERLQQIVTSEGVEAEPEALERIARRAAGSMRDSQSILEQLLASAGEKLTTDDVNRLLGTADEQRLAELVEHLFAGDAAAALSDLDGAIKEGSDVGQLMDQLLGYLRDVMAAAVGCPPEAFQYVLPSESAMVSTLAGQLGVETVLAAMQVVDSTLSRMRYTTRGRTLAELALVRICRLGNLDELSEVIAQVKSGVPMPETTVAATKPSPLATPRAASSDAAKKKDLEPVASKTASGGGQSNDAITESKNVIVVTEENVAQIWQQVLSLQTEMTRDYALKASVPAISAPNRLVLRFPAQYTFPKSYCERPEQVARFEQALEATTGQRVRVEFVLLPGETRPLAPTNPAARPASSHQRMLAKAEHPLVRRATELFDAQPVRLEEPGTIN